MATRKDKTRHLASRVSRLFPILVPALLSACADGGVSSIFGEAPTASRAPKSGIQQVDLPAGPAASAGADAETRQAARSEPTPVDDNPRQLVGLGPSSLSERLGSPGFVRRDGPAEVWQYTAEACILDVFLYREGEALTVFYVALRGRGVAERSRRECFAGMLRTQAELRRG